MAKEYVAKVQTYLKENADKIKELAGENAAIVSAVEAVTAIEPASVVSGVLNAVDEKANEVKDAADKKVQETKDAAKQKANDAIDNAAKDVKKGLGL